MKIVFLIWFTLWFFHALCMEDMLKKVLKEERHDKK